MTQSLEKRVIRKLTRRIVPFIMLLYFIAYLDRVNIGFAALTMNEDIGLSAAAFGFGAGVFFIGYFLFEVPSNLILHRVGARVWIARIMFTWGIISGAMALVQGPIGLYVLRFLLGAAEAGFSRDHPVPELLVSGPASRGRDRFLHGRRTHLPRHRIADFRSVADHGRHTRTARLAMAFPGRSGAGRLADPVVLLYLTDRPENAKWLGDEEREWLVAEMKAEETGVAQEHGTESALRALSNPWVLSLALVYFGTSAGLYTVGIWSPQIIAQHGVGPFATGIINACRPYSRSSQWSCGPGTRIVPANAAGTSSSPAFSRLPGW